MKRTFTASSNIIHSLIKAQAGTLEKGILEAVMNSVDAQASKVEITLTNTHLSIKDDGRGFQTESEIFEFFEVFGFEHELNLRQIGQHGLGRAQLWNFLPTTWRTNSFKMLVDIRKSGLEYDLLVSEPHIAGMHIEGDFYEPFSQTEVRGIVKQLAEMVEFVQIPVLVNGEQMNVDVSSVKWTHETEDAFIRLNQVQKQLVVYNQGFKVQSYSAEEFGTGGVVVTKTNVKLQLNMSRNEILLTQCKVWKRIRPFLREKSEEAVRKAPSTRLTEEQLSYLAQRFIAGEVPYEEISKHRLIVDMLGDKLNVYDFLHKASETLQRTVTVVATQQAGPVVEQAHNIRDCFVLSQKTLQLFGVVSVQALLDRLIAQVKALSGFYFVSDKANPTKALKAVEDWRICCEHISNAHTEVLRSKWTPREIAAMASLRQVNTQIVNFINQVAPSQVGVRIAERELRVGISETAYAWTNGLSKIVFERRLLAELDAGLAGASHVVEVFLHEYLHEEPTTGTHVHDLEFYTRIARLGSHYPSKERYSCWRSKGGITADLMRFYLKQCDKRKVPIKAALLQHLAIQEQYVITEDSPDIGED